VDNSDRPRRAGLRPIAVVAPSRSGTSVVTRVLNLLGAPLCVDSDLYSAPDNPDGHWESQTVMRINEQVLARRHASWGLPPAVPWSLESALEEPTDAGHQESMVEAREQFLSVHPSAGWLCKDPRFCFTLPFWELALGVKPVIVVVIRHPDEVVASLVADGMPRGHAASLWERFARGALTVAQDHEVATVNFGALVEDPRSSCLQLAELLEPAGTSVRRSKSAVAAEAVRPSTRRHTFDGELSVELTGVQRELWETLQSLPVWSEQLSSPIPLESALTGELIEALRGLDWLNSEVARLRAERR
jgi:hypothetical protein